MSLKKSFISLIFALLLIFNAKAKAESYDQAVSLGFSCQVVWQLEHNGYRTLAYPFDWFHTHFNSLLSFISNKGSNLFDLDKISVVGAYPGSPTHLQVIDLVYGIISYHDFLTSPYLGNYAEIKAKYDRRIKRFFDLLSSNKRVLFVRQGSSRAEIEYLDYVLHHLYPKLSYTILAVNDTQEYHNSWGLGRIKNFYIQQLPNDWQGDFTRWKEVLSHFYIIPSREPRPPGEVW